jgi:hypothetical protein
MKQPGPRVLATRPARGHESKRLDRAASLELETVCTGHAPAVR